MSLRVRNSMAEAMTVLVTAAMWIAIAAGIAGLPVLVLGLTASLSGGSAELPGIRALADGVSPAQFALGLAGLVVIVPGVVFICLQLRRMLLTLVAGDPFVPENARRLARVGTAIAIMELFRVGAVLLISAVPELAGEAAPKISIQPILWISVAALFILAQVFREGARLREEEKMTI